MSDLNIRVLLESRLKAWADVQVPPISIAFENQAFTPPNVLHLECYMLPATTKPISLKGDRTVWSGLFQITIVEQERVGSKTVGDISKMLSTLFSTNLRLTDGVVNVQVTKPLSNLVASMPGAEYRLPTRFEYRADNL
jgi:Bacteriophage related domain of unknown function